MQGTAREAAVRTLAAWRRSGAWSDRQLNTEIKRAGLDRRDAALATGLCYGVLRNRELIDFCIREFSSVRLSKIEPLVMDILRVAVFQLNFMDRIPSSAAVNEAVTLAKRLANDRAASFANGILRAMTRAAAMPEPPRDERYLSVKYSHPMWLVEEFCALLGEEGCEELLRADNTPVPVTAQVNTLETTAGEVMSELEAAGASAAVHPWLENCLEITGMGGLEELPTFTEGRIMIQDAAARMSVIAAGPKPGMNVIDACAAPGGKSFAAAIMMKNRGKILSCDLNFNRLMQVGEDAARLSVDIITPRRMDARERDEELVGTADLVIADVPCSGLGVIRKKPDIRYKNREEFGGLPEVQLDIIRNLASYVKPGGVLLYSTCTLRREENEGVVERFLGETREFEPSRFELPGPVGRVSGGMLTLWPHIHGTDGFFIARMVRRG